jgi:hypothetical protein
LDKTTDEGLTKQFYSTAQKDPEAGEDLGNMECVYEVRTGLTAYTMM